jgi:uncharacterized protein YifN (PemK superfamily)
MYKPMLRAIERQVGNLNKVHEQVIRELNRRRSDIDFSVDLIPQTINTPTLRRKYKNYLQDHVSNQELFYPSIIRDITSKAQFNLYQAEKDRLETVKNNQVKARDDIVSTLPIQKNDLKNIEKKLVNVYVDPLVRDHYSKLYTEWNDKVKQLNDNASSMPLSERDRMATELLAYLKDVNDRNYTPEAIHRIGKDIISNKLYPSINTLFANRGI